MDLKVVCKNVDWKHLTHSTILRRVVIKKIMSLRMRYKVRNLLAFYATARFSRMTLHHRIYSESYISFEVEDS
jgi:hypothetical protein